MISPLKRQWDDVRGNAKWDAIRMIFEHTPWVGSVTVGASRWWKDATALEVLTYVFIAFLVISLISVILSHVAWMLRDPSLELAGEDCPILPENHEGGVHACRIGIRNPSHLSKEIVSVEILEMDASASRDKIGTGIPFPIELFPLDGASRILHPGEIMPLHFFEMPRLHERFGGPRFRGTFPRRIPSHLALNADYRIRIRVLIRDTPEYRERFILRVSGDSEFATFTLTHVPRWKTVP